jgi:hypothetical protein
MNNQVVTGLAFIACYFGLTLLLAVIETLRIDAVKGKVANVKKVWSVTGAVVAFIVLVCIFHTWSLLIIPLGIACIGIRGVFYDPTLNLCLGRYIDAESIKTNSKVDGIERKRKINFWTQRAMYLGLFICGFALYVISIFIFYNT